MTNAFRKIYPAKGGRWDDAIAWLSRTPWSERPAPLVDHLQRQFGLSPAEAELAVCEATYRRGNE